MRPNACLRGVVKKIERKRHYWIWAEMIQRCTNRNNPNYKNYGGRGIAVCSSWRAFEQFIADMGPRPSRKHTLERIDNDAGYSPSNCKWVTRRENNRNKRLYRCNRTGVSGVTQRKSGVWLARIRVDGKLHRLGQSHDFFEACCLRKSAESRLLP